MARLMQYMEAFMSLIYPNICPVCKESLTYKKTPCCLACYSDLSSFHEIESITDNLIFEKLYGRVDVKSAFGLYYFNTDSKVQKLIHAFKYHKRKSIANWVGQQLGVIIKQEEIKYDFIIPAPTSTKRIAKRGYNQATEIAKGIAKEINSPVIDFLKVHNKKSQSSTALSRVERLNKLVESIYSERKLDINGSSVLLVDDVITEISVAVVGVGTR